jgi:formate hydrogenlyase subunit 3/multisubunit Na+/H+ antiporter MnhD subunit
MELLLVGLGALALGGLLAALLARWPATAGACGVGGCVAAALAAAPAVVSCLGGHSLAVSGDWPTVPGARFSLHLDALSAFFLLPVLGTSCVLSFAALSWLRAPGRPVGRAWPSFNFLVAGMALVVLADNALLFLVAWEVMSLAGWFLITLDDSSPAARDAGWTYLIAAHFGAAFLIALFAVLSQLSGSLEMADWARVSGAAPGTLAALFVLALVGFGAKAGVWPFHVWLPDAYAAAPGPTPALLSGVMSKLGFYGLLRVLTWLGPPADWWAWALIGLGAASAVLGILRALAEHDLKRVLACSSIENAGIILLGVGVGLLGRTSGHFGVALLGLGGAMLHVLNHSLCKSTLFASAAAVEECTGTLELDRLGGLLKRLPVLGSCFLVGAVAICGLPPLNSFASEFLIYLGAFQETSRLPEAPQAVAPLAVIGSLALAGGLAVAAFTRAAGAVFLGSPRQPLELGERPGALAQAPPVVLAAGCVLLGLLAPLVVTALAAPLALVAARPVEETAYGLGDASGPLSAVVGVSALFLFFLGGLVLLRRRLLRGREVTTGPTWGCGYAAPTERMQYTASSFAEPLLQVGGALVGYRRQVPRLTDYFPGPGSEASTEAGDLAERGGYRPAHRAFLWALFYPRYLQSGRVQLYVLYIVLTLLALLVAYLGA